MSTITKTVAKVLLIRSDGRLLILRRSDTDSRRPLQWDFPGGMVDAGEYAEDSAVREVGEETGLQINRGDLRLVYATSACFEAEADKPSRAVTWLFFIASCQAGDVRLSFEHDQSQWVDPGVATAMFEYDVHLGALEYISKYNLFHDVTSGS